MERERKGYVLSEVMFLWYLSGLTHTSVSERCEKCNYSQLEESPPPSHRPVPPNDLGGNLDTFPGRKPVSLITDANMDSCPEPPFPRPDLNFYSLCLPSSFYTVKPCFVDFSGSPNERVYDRKRGLGFVCFEIEYVWVSLLLLMLLK